MGSGTKRTSLETLGVLLKYQSNKRLRNPTGLLLEKVIYLYFHEVSVQLSAIESRRIPRNDKGTPSRSAVTNVSGKVSGTLIGFGV